MNELILMKTEEQLLAAGYQYETRNNEKFLAQIIKGTKFTVTEEMMKSMGKPLLIKYGYFNSQNGGIIMIDDSMFVKFLDLDDHPEYLL